MDNIDKYGHCAKCHKSLLVTRVVDGKVIQMFTPEYSEAEFLLTDGSKMRVCICTKCKENDLNSPVVKDYIMEAVKNGWQLEVDTLVSDEKRPDWDLIRGKSHMAKYRNLEIDCYSENLDKHVVEDRKKVLLEEKNVAHR